VALTARSAQTPAEMARAARERLGALARAHDLTMPDLAREEREAGGAAAHRATTLHALLRAIALPFADPAAGGKDRVRIEGPDVPVRGAAVTSLALLLHEFATNAAKYGALSAPAGRVRVEGGALRLVWRERGGPRLAGKPAEEGFGGVLARMTVGSQLGGRMESCWEAEGLTIHLSIPLEALGK
jgi:two-component system CheB/CheR fusion protein